MGAGNRFRLREDSDIAAMFVRTECMCEPEAAYCSCWQDTRDNLLECILRHPTVTKYGLRDDRTSAYYGELFIVKLEAGHYDEIVIQFEYDSHCPDHMHMLNYEKCYHSLIKHVNKEFEVYEGFGYTSAKYEIGEYGK